MGRKESNKQRSYIFVGVGCTKKDADNWIAHQDDFNALLANLSQNHGSQGSGSDEDAAKVSSLEHKSKTSRGRVQ